MTGPHDHPFEDVAKRAEQAIASGATVYFKWTCQRCGTRQTFEDANVLYREGSCEECGAITNLEEHGCNFVLVMSFTPKGDEALKKL